MLKKTKPFFIRFSVLMTVLIPVLTVFAIPAGAFGSGEADGYPLRADSHMVGLDVLFCGDSICDARYYDGDDRFRWGWAKRIGSSYGLDLAQNQGTDGASVSSVRGENTVVSQLIAEKNNEYDIIVLEGGTNDGWFFAPIGQCTEDRCRSHEDFTVSTYAGGLEDLFCTAKELFPTAIVCYIIAYRTPDAGFGCLNDMSGYYAVGRQVCEKWDVPYLDLYSDEVFNREIWKPDLYTVDNIHPNASGYDVLYPYIGEFMDQLAASVGPSFLCGDTDGDGSVTPADARLTLRMAVGLESYEINSPEFLAADADPDGQITPSDARLILRFSVGLEEIPGK